MTKNALFVKTSKFEGTILKRSEIYAKIIGILNESAKEDIREVIVDATVLAAVKGATWRTVDILTGSDSIVLFSIMDADDTNLQVTEEFRKKLVLSLGAFLDGVQYNNRYLKMGGKRFAIPSLNGYDCLKIDSIPFGIARPEFNTRWIVSPFTQPKPEEVKRTLKADFVQSVMESSSFERLVDFVRHNHRPGGVGCAEDIRNAYKRLIEEYHDTVLEQNNVE